MSIAAEIEAGIQEAVDATGGSLTVRIARKGTRTGPAHAPTFGTDTFFDCVALVSSFKAKDRANTLIEAGDVKVLVGSVTLTIEPTTADRIEINGKMHDIVEVMPLRPSGDDLMYTIAARLLTGGTRT